MNVQRRYWIHKKEEECEWTSLMGADVNEQCKVIRSWIEKNRLSSESQRRADED